jgi:hypothetical protein
MKMIVHNLPELVEENQYILGQLLLMTMCANSFKVDGVRIEFVKES